MYKTVEELLPLLDSEKDEKYKSFSEKIISDTKYPILGVRVPTVKKIAKAFFYGDIPRFDGGFTCYEQCLLTGLMIAGNKKISFDEKTELFKRFILYADSWGITDSVAAAFKDVSKNRDKALKFVYSLLLSPLVYARRFAVVILTLYFTGEYFREEHIKKVLSSETGEYYFDMAIAWYISVLAAKNRDYAFRLIENRALPPFIHYKAISKCTESFRISDEDKANLKTLKTKKSF